MAYLSNGLCIDPVVLPVRADEPDIDDAIRIVDPYHDAILVAGDVEYRATDAGSVHFRDFSFACFRRRTPAPPPFSSMNTTPSRMKISLIKLSVAGSPAYLPTSMFVIVFRCRPVAAARSLTVQFSAALAILTCALVTGYLLCYCHMCTEHK